jgi:hypothetical protein
MPRCPAHPLRWIATAAAALMLTAGCSTPRVTNTSVAITAAAVAGHIPSTQIQQVYYLGVFDPRDQLPPTIYRVRVRGQASVLASTRFASGWVRAELVDSLSGAVELPGERKAAGTAEAGGAGTGALVERIDMSPYSERRLILFGPEGFREAPRNHRLVIAMGSSPEAFFREVDEALGVVARVTQDSRSGPVIEKALWEDLSHVREVRTRLQATLNAARVTLGDKP